MKTNNTLIAWSIAAVVVFLLMYGSYKNTAPAEGFKQVSKSIYQDPSTGRVDEVVDFLKERFLRNPDSYKGLKWFQMKKTSEGNFQVRHQFKCSTPEGEPMDPVTILFTLGPDGNVINYK